LTTTTAATRKTEILRRAAEIFCAKGFHATSMSEIADSVELTKAGLYYHVDGKEDLLFSIVSYGMDRLESWIERARVLEDAQERLRSVIHDHAAGITSDGTSITLLVDAVDALSPDHRRRIRDRQRAYVGFIQSTLCELRREGRLIDVDPSVAAFALLGSVMWIARWYRRDGRLSGEQIADEITALGLSSILKKEK